MKRLISVMLSVMMLLGMLPGAAVLPAGAADVSDSYTIVTEVPASLLSKDSSTKGAWYINGSVFDYTEGAANYTEIAAEGYLDTGSLHVYQDNVANHDMSVGMFIGGQAAGTYTVKFYVKGDVGYNNQTCKFYPYGTDAQVSNLSTILGGTVVADWTEVSYEVEVSSDFYYLIFSFSKYNWVTDFCVDNIQLLNSSGVDVLAGAGNFYSLQEVTCSSAVTGQYPFTLDTTKVDDNYDAPTDEWVPFSPYVEYKDTWPAWESGVNYGEIVPNGYKDAGSLHLVSAGSKNTGVVINPKMVSGESYTIGMWVKGASNGNRALSIYGNGDPCLIGNPAYCSDPVLSTVPTQWTYIEKTFTATRNSLAIFAVDWGTTDIYIDNISLINSEGTDLLADMGNFCKQQAALLSIDTSLVAEPYKAYQGVWTPFCHYPAENGSWHGTWPAWDSTIENSNYGEIVASGNKDDGALHLKSAPSRNTGVAIGVGMTAGQTYTLGMWVKGTASSNKMLGLYGNGDGVIIGNPNYCADAVLSAVPADWTYVEKIFTADRSNLILVAADWGVTDIYIDNITLKGSDGVDLLSGYGDFVVGGEEEEPEEPTEPTTPEYKDPTEEGWIGRDAYTQLELGVDYDYSFAVLGDIQHITDYTPDDLHYLFDYILDNKDSKNIQFVFGMGDTTNDNRNEANNLREWKLAQEQFFRFNGVIPYTVIRGNHDVVVRMNAYFADPAKPGYTDQLDGFYQEGSVVNVWKEFQVAGVDYLSLLIDYESSDSVLAWAADVIESHPNHRVIVNTHVYMNPDGTYDNEMNPQFADVGIINNAQQVWDKLISQHENIFMVLCGHTSTDDVLIQQKTGVHGNQITEIRVDSQYTDLVFMNKDGDHLSGPENGVGMVTLMYFKNDGTQVAVEHYSVLRQWYRQLQTFEIEEYAHYGWRYDETEEASYDVDAYQPATDLVQVPAILQDGLGTYALSDLLTQNGRSYSGTGVSIIPDYNMNLGTHTYALHSGTRTVEPSETYTISYKIKGLSEAGKTWTQIHFCRSALGGSDTWESQWGEGQVIQGPVSDWQTVSYDVTMDDKTSAIEIYYIVNGSELLIDDVSVVKKGSTENVITNGDFELGTDGQFPTGFYTMKTGGIGKVEKVSGIGVDGSAAVRVEPRPGYMLKNAQTVEVSADTRYTFCYTMRINGDTTDVMPVVRLYDANGTVTTVQGERISGKSDWKTLHFTFQTAADTVSLQIGLLVYGGRVDVDDLSLSGGSMELLPNGNFNAGLQGFAGEFVQGLQEGTVVAVSSARPNSLIVTAKAEDGVLNAYDGESLLGTVDALYSELEHKVNFGLRISDSDAANAVAAWITQRHTENLWVISDTAELLNTILSVNSNVRVVLDCTASSALAESSTYPYVLISELSAVSNLKQGGKKVILSCTEATEESLMSGADALLTEDSLAAIAALEAIVPESAVDTWSLTLGEDIGVNFHVAIARGKEADTVVSITAGDQTTNYTVADMIPLDGSYKVSAQVAAAQMTDEITVQIVEGGTAVWSKTYTVRQYAEYILAGDYDDATKKLVREMLSYGGAAQTYFGYREDKLATNGIDLTGACSVEIPADAELTMATEGTVDGLSFYAASLIFTSKTAVRFYFDGDVTNCTFTVNGQNLTAMEKNGKWYVEAGQIGPNALNETVTVLVTKDGKTLTVSYSPMDYMVRMNGKATVSDSLKTLLKAMYNYHLAAKAYEEAQNA